MRQVLIPGTEITTSALAFGCAGLFRDPSRRVRRRLLDVCFDLGIRHFDTAPMYGLGLSEVELGRFARDRRHAITIATKFGIDPTWFGAVVGRGQVPVRHLLAKAPALGSQVRSSVSGPASGPVASLLYRLSGFDARAARESLEASLRRMRTEYVDLLLLHEPSVDAAIGADLHGYLEDARARGVIRAWGIAGERAGVDNARRQFGGCAPIVQVPFDFRTELTRVEASDLQGRSFFHILGEPANAIRNYLRADPERQRRWRARVGADCTDPEFLARMLLLTVAKVHPDSLLMFTSTRSEHIVSAARTLAVSHVDASVQAAAFGELLEVEARGIFGVGG